MKFLFILFLLFIYLFIFCLDLQIYDGLGPTQHQFRANHEIRLPYEVPRHQQPLRGTPHLPNQEIGLDRVIGSEYLERGQIGCDPALQKEGGAVRFQTHLRRAFQ